MGGLLKADFRRVAKDKLLLVMGILAVAFAAFTPLLYALLFSDPVLGEDPMFSGLIYAKSQFFSSFSLGNNLGFIAPVLLAIVLCKDFSFGTVRNKIIAGKSRSQIFLSMFFVCAAVFVGVLLLHAFATLAISLIFFEYQPTAFTQADFWYFLESLGFAILSLLFVSAMLSWLCASMKNVGLAIVLYIAITFLFILVSSVLVMVSAFLQVSGDAPETLEILQFIDRINVFNAATYIGAGTSYTWKDVLYLTVPATVGTAAFVGLGLLQFNKKDLK